MGEEPETIDYDTAIDERYRVYASISFAVLLLGVGVPLWWHTTAVPRVALPYAGIDELSNLEIVIRTRITVATVFKDRAESLAREIKAAFQTTNSINQLDVVPVEISQNFVTSGFSLHELDKVAANFDSGPGSLLLLEAAHLNDAVLVGPHRTLYFSSDSSASRLVRVLSEWMLQSDSLSLTKHALAEPTVYSLDEENRRRFPASPAYDILITAVNPDPEKLRVDWDLRQLARDYIHPILDEISMLSNFSVKSQWLYLLPLDVKPKRVPDSGPLLWHYALPEEVLPQLVTPLEKKLASQVGLHPTINFVMYMVPCDSAPLHIYTRSGHRSKNINGVEAFLSPRWGGVVLINPPMEACTNVSYANEPVSIVPEESTVVGTFLAQLRLLLGIPEPKFISGVDAVPLVGFSREWEVDALLRVRSVEQLTSAKLTLQSLARLLTEISNIVITDVVGNRIKSALQLVEDSAEELRKGNLLRGFFFSKEAFVTAEAAFSDPTLLALLYFPEDQKYAVYVPLFLPAMIPVLLSLKSIYRYYFPGKSKTEQKSSAKESVSASGMQKSS